MIKCPNCGSSVPEGSDFCNHCGTHLDHELRCPSCGTIIPDDSAFCPKCGKKVTSENVISFNEQQEQAEARREQQRKQEEAWRRERERERERERQRRLEQEAEDDDDDDETDSGTGNYFRNLLLGIAAVILLIVALMGIRKCNSGNNDRSEDRKEKAEQTAQPSGQDPRDILAAELSRNNLNGDGANPVLAVMVTGNNDKPDRIWGITLKPNLATAEKGFFKIYQLTSNGSAWNLELLTTKYIQDRNITFETGSLKVESEQMPRAVKVAGKDCLYFAYMNTLSSEGSRGRVSLNLYDVDGKRLTSLDYEGEIKSRDDGSLYIYGKPLDPINNDERKFLKQEADKVKILYFPTEEELKAEEEKLKAEEEAKNKAQGDSSGSNWEKSNKEKMEAVKNGEEVVIKSPTYDNPVEGVNIKNKHKSVQNEGYIVISNKSGAVYGFNKSTRKYFTIYSPAGGSAEPTDIGFGDSKNNILRYRTADGRRFQYNLATGATKAIE